MIHFDDSRAPARFWAKVSPEPNSGCWLWAGAHNEKGYGDFWNGARNERAHRYAYRTLVRDMPDEWLICHRCDTPACVNPAHLAPGTAKMNTADMIAKGRYVPRQKRGSHCSRGHALTSDNTLAAGGCRTCKRTLYHARKAR